MADITINDLVEITEVTDSHFLAVDDGTTSNKISVENFNASATASAAAYAQAAADSASAASDSELAAKGYKETVEQAINDASTIVSNAQTYANAAESSKNDASGYASAASTSASQAASSATQAATSAAGVNAYVTEAKSYAEGGTGTRVGEDEDNAKYYSQSAHTSETNAASSESNAATSETNAASSERNAATSESNASGYASSASADALKAEGYAVGSQNGTPAISGEPYYQDNAKYYKEEAATSATNASTSETNAGLSETAASGYADAADDSAEDSEAWAVGTRDGVDVPATDPAYHNNAKYWADVASGGVSGVSSFNGRSGNVVPASGDYAANIIEYVNTTSGLAATDVQDAIDELNTDLGTLDSSLATVAKTGAYSDLSGKPSLGTAAAKDVPASGNASSAQVVLGSDTRLTDARTPVSHTHTKSEITDFPTLGTAAAKDSTNAVTQSSTDLVESGAVYTEVSSLTSALTNLDTEVDKAYKSDDATENTIDDADYIPFYDTSAQAMKKISKADANFGGGGAGSLFVIRTDETELYGKTVSITDGTLVWQGKFDNSGVAEVVGVTSIGALTITSTDGIETAETIYTVKNYSRYDIKLNFYTVYGFRVDATKSTANVSYQVLYNGDKVENYDYTPGYMNFTTDTWIWGSWTGEEFFMPKPVLIKQDYSEKIYLNPDNLSLDEDGNDVSSELTGATDGYNAMMEWGRNGKKIWYKLVPETDDATYTCYICDKQLDSGFKAWSFYDANNVLGEHFYTSIYNGSVVSNTLRSLSGKAPNNTTAGATQITYAKANNKNGESYAWYIDTFADRILINLLLILVTKSTNSDVVGYGNYTGGSSASNLINSGLGNTKGMFYGKQSNGVVKVFGMENYFANCWRRMAGLILSSGVELYKLTYGTADGSSSAGYREDDNAPSNYLTGKTIATNLSSSYISKESAKADGALLASAFGGTNGNYYSDACWSSTGVKYARVGGTCSNGSACGAFALNLSNALSISDWTLGAALSLKPLAE